MSCLSQGADREDLEVAEHTDVLSAPPAALVTAGALDVKPHPQPSLLIGGGAPLQAGRVQLAGR